MTRTVFNPLGFTDLGFNRRCAYLTGALILLALLSAGALAQETSTPEAGAAVTTAEETEEGLDLFSLLFKGGWVMIPIALASVLALTLTIERFISISRKKLVPNDFLDGFKSRFNGGEVDLEQGKTFCKEHPSTLSRLVGAGLPKLDRGMAVLQRTLEDAGAREVDRLKRSLKPLSMIATIAPLLGLLGTVYGMISAFQAATVAGVGKSDVLAQGIYEALVTTAAGLTLAIPVLIVHQILSNRVDGIVDDLDECADDFMDYALKRADA